MKHKILFWGTMGISIVVGGMLIGVGGAMGGFDLPKEEQFVIHSDDSASTGKYDAVKNLEFELSACDVEIKAGSEFGISGKGVVSEVIDDGETWHIYSPKRKWYRWFKNRGGGEVTVTLPAGRQFEDLELSFAAADLDAEELNAKSVEISGGAGSMTINSLAVAEDLDLSIGAGEFTVESAKLSGDSSITCGAGELNLHLEQLSGDVDAGCGMGEMNLFLPGARGDYGFNNEAFMGSVQVENKEGRVLTSEGEEVMANLDLSCGMGALNVSFQ